MSIPKIIYQVEPSVSLITQSIRTQRALQAVVCSFDVSYLNRLETAFSKAMNQPVTPYDIVSFLRGGLEWVKSEYVITSTTQELRRCIEPDCDQPATEQGFYPNPVFCWAHYCAIHSIDPSICGITPSNSVFPCSLIRDHQGPHNSIVG